MLADNLKMPLLRLTNYASKTDNAISHVKMNINVDNNTSSLNAELSAAAERSELSDIQSESIAGLFNQILEEIKLNYKGLPLNSVSFDSDVDLLGLKNNTLKIICTFKINPKTFSTNFFSYLLDKTSNYEESQKIEHAATNLVLNLSRGRLQTVDLIFDNEVPNDNFYQISFSNRVSNELNNVVTEYEGYSMNVAPKLSLNYVLTKRKKLQFLKGKSEGRANLIKEQNSFELNSVQDVLAQANIALSLAQSAHISGISFMAHGNKKYTPKFDLLTKQSELDTIGTIDLNHEVAKTYQYIFKTILNNYSFPSLSKNWSEIISVTMKMKQGKYVLDFKNYKLIKYFDNKNIDTVETLLKAQALLFKGKARIKKVKLVTKNNSALQTVLYIDSLNTKISNIKGMRIDDIDIDDPKAKITRIFQLTHNGYTLTKERFEN